MAEDEDDERWLSHQEQLEPQIEAMSVDIGELSMHLSEISTWHGLTMVGFVFQPPLAWGFRSGGDEQFVVAEIEFPVDHEQLAFDPCDEER